MLAVMRSVPLRVKLVAAVLALVTAALVVISVSSAFFLRSYLIDQVDTELRSTERRRPCGRAQHTGRRQGQLPERLLRGRAPTTAACGPRSTTVAASSRPTSCRPFRRSRPDLERTRQSVPYDARRDRVDRAAGGCSSRPSRTAGCSRSAQTSPTSTTPSKQLRLDRRAGRRRGADHAGLGRRGDRPDQPQAAARDRADRRRDRRRRPDPAGARPGAGRRASPRPSWAGCPAR